MNGRIAYHLIAVIVLAGASVEPASAGVDLDEPCSGLEFQIGSDFRLATFEGTAISWKRLSSSTRGWRLGVSPLITKDEREFWSDGYEKHRHYACSVNFMPLFLSQLRDRTRFYWGVGPVAGIEYDDWETYLPDHPYEPEHSFELKRTWFFGFGAVVGVEYFFTGRMSLMGEYGLDARREEIRSTRYDAYDAKQWKVDTRNARLGLSVLF